MAFGSPGVDEFDLHERLLRRIRVKILSTTICYPTPQNPDPGLFVRKRIEAIARHAEVRVVCPVPYFPGYSPEPPEDHTHATPPVYYPKMHYLPGVLKFLDASFYARAFARCVRAFRSEYPFDVIDAHFVWPDGVGAAIVAWKLGVPAVVTVRGKIVSQTRYRFRRRRIAYMLESIDGRITVSESLARRVQELTKKDLDIHVIPNGVDTGLFHPTDRDAARRTLGLDPDARYIVSVGQVREIKGFDRLVEVLPEVRKRAGDVRLLLIGSEIGERNYERRVRHLIRRNGLEPFVALLGSQEPAAVAEYLNAADVFALATRSEGWCNAIHESLAVGTPVVTTDVGGNREQVCDDTLGLLVPFGQSHALTAALVDSLKRDWDRSSIAAAGSRRSWDQVAVETLDCFEQVLSRAPLPKGGKP